MNICLDHDVIQKHKAMGSNISDLCNTFLANYGKNVQKVKQRAIVKASEMVKAIEEQRKEEARGKELKELLIEAAKHRADNANKTNLILRHVCERFKLTWAEAVRRMERA